MKVFRMNDYDWVASNLSKEETNEWYKKYCGVDDEDQPLEDVKECDLDKNSQWTILEDEKRIAELEAEGVDSIGDTKKPKHGDVMRYDGEWCIFVPFREAIKGRENEQKPFITASTEW